MPEASDTSVPTGVPITTDLDELVDLARSLVEPGNRRILGLTGAPGSGKSRLAEALTAAVGPQAVFVPLDGFHLADPELRRLGRHPRKGAADTFDGAGYVHLLRRLRDRTDDVVYAPSFDRGLEAAIAGSIPVPADVPLVVTEGNYLLLDTPVWDQVPGLLDTCWFVDPGETTRLERLVARHVRYGRSPEEAQARSWGPDQDNAELITRTRPRADRIVRLAPDPRLA
ncbi:nucleoside/nucleotide kinase family protein [Kineococcus sp. NPDC059986]|uniref:nucleoside/nucleotide kinase family protein n=1 Tax=Kineococcus sp. NPDC059986 TaxID=3155538 RepID=UPI00345072CE